MNDILDNRNRWIVIIVILMVAIGGSVVASTLSTTKMKKQIDYLYNGMKPILDQNPQPTSQTGINLNELSNEAMRYINRVKEDITGTPTWLIDGEVYKGFDIQNNIIPKLDDVFSSKEIIIFSSPTCGFCQKAIEYLTLNNIKFTKVCYPLHDGDYAKCDNTYIK